MDSYRKRLPKTLPLLAPLTLDQTAERILFVLGPLFK